MRKYTKNVIGYDHIQDCMMDINSTTGELYIPLHVTAVDYKIKLTTYIENIYTTVDYL